MEMKEERQFKVLTCLISTWHTLAHIFPYFYQGFTYVESNLSLVEHMELGAAACDGGCSDQSDHSWWGSDSLPCSDRDKEAQYFQQCTRPQPLSCPDVMILELIPYCNDMRSHIKSTVAAVLAVNVKVQPCKQNTFSKRM